MSPATSAVISGRPQIDMKKRTTNGDGEAGVADVAAERHVVRAAVWSSEHDDEDDRDERSRRRGRGRCASARAAWRAPSGRRSRRRSSRRPPPARSWSLDSPPVSPRNSSSRLAVSGTSAVIADPGLAERDRERGDRLLVGGEARARRRRARRPRRPAGRGSTRARALRLGRSQPVAARRRREQLARARPRRRSRPLRMIATRLQSSSTSCEQVAGEQDRDPLAGEAAHEVAHVAHPGRVEPGRRLVEQEQPRLAQQRGGDPEPLAHAVRVAADPVLRPVAQLDELEHLVDPGARAAARRSRRAAAGSAARRGTGRSAAPRRSRRRRRAPSRPSTSGSRPNSRAEPSVGRIRPSSIRSEVVLPAPFGPR